MGLIKMITGIFYGLLSIIKRLMCFLNVKRGRRRSGGILPLHSDGPTALSNSVIQQSFPSNDHSDMELQSWDSWGIEEQNKKFSQNPNEFSNGTEDQEEEEIDYFQDMVPQVKRTRKILIRQKEEFCQKNEGFSNRLAVSSDVPIEGDPTLGAWDDSENAWGEEVSEDLSWEAQAAIKERRKQEREQRHLQQMRKKQEREQQRLRSGSAGGGAFTAVKLS